MGINDLCRMAAHHARRAAKPSLGILVFLTGCINLDPDPGKTHVVTYPKPARIYVNGTYRGMSPVVVVLPRDGRGNFEGTNVIRAVPVIPGIYAQTRRYAATERTNPAPSRIMIDLREPDPFDPENQR